MYSWERGASLYLRYYQTEMFEDEAKGGGVFGLDFIPIFLSPGSGNFVSLYCNSRKKKVKWKVTCQVM